MTILRNIGDNKFVFAFILSIMGGVGYFFTKIEGDAQINKKVSKSKDKMEIIMYGLETEKMVLKNWKEYHNLPPEMELYNERINFLQKEIEEKGYSRGLLHAIQETYAERGNLKESYNKLDILKKEKKNLSSKIDSLNNERFFP